MESQRFAYRFISHSLSRRRDRSSRCARLDRAGNVLPFPLPSRFSSVFSPSSSSEDETGKPQGNLFFNRLYRIYTRIWCVKKGGEDDLPLGRRHWIKRRTKGGEAVRERERDRSQRGRRERDRERKNGAIRDECAHGNTCTDGIERDG